MPKTADHVDKHVGLRLRLRRERCGLSQEKVASALGVTFQQLQKYENGTNRLSASRLWQASRVLDVPLSHFYEGLTASVDDAPSLVAHDDEAPESTREGLRLMRTFLSIEDAKVRRQIVGLVEEISASAKRA